MNQKAGSLRRSTNSFPTSPIHQNEDGEDTKEITSVIKKEIKDAYGICRNIRNYYKYIPTNQKT